MSLPLEKAYYSAVASGSPVLFGKTMKDGEMRVQIAVEFVVQDADFAGETITWVGHFTDKTAARTIESLQIAGWQGEDVSELADVPGSTALTNEVSLTCEPEEYDGAWTLKVKWVNRPGGGKFKFKEQLSGGDLKAFGAQLRATVQSVRASGGAPRKASTGSGAAQRSGSSRSGGSAHPNAPGNDFGGYGGAPSKGGPDDDIPFASCAIEHEPSPIAPVLRGSL